MRIMGFSQLISKIASDKNSTKLGKIVKIEKLLGKTIKKYRPYAMILVSKRFKKDVVVPIDIEKIIKVGEQYVWFDVLKEEFDKKTKRISDIKAEREIYHGSIREQESHNQFWTGVDFTNLSHKSKERKR